MFCPDILQRGCHGGADFYLMSHETQEVAHYLCRILVIFEQQQTQLHLRFPSRLEKLPLGHRGRSVQDRKGHREGRSKTRTLASRDERTAMSLREGFGYRKTQAQARKAFFRLDFALFKALKNARLGFLRHPDSAVRDRHLQKLIVGIGREDLDLSAIRSELHRIADNI